MVYNDLFIGGANAEKLVGRQLMMDIQEIGVQQKMDAEKEVGFQEIGIIAFTKILQSQTIFHWIGDQNRISFGNK